MRELIDSKSVERILLFIAVAGPLMGLILGSLLGAHERIAARRVVAGILLGSIGSLIYGMWKVYNLITNAFGLDSVANLGLQLVLFAALGAILGVVVIRVSSILKRLWV